MVLHITSTTTSPHCCSLLCWTDGRASGTALLAVGQVVSAPVVRSPGYFRRRCRCRLVVCHPAWPVSRRTSLITRHAAYSPTAEIPVAAFPAAELPPRQGWLLHHPPHLFRR